MARKGGKQGRQAARPAALGALAGLAGAGAVATLTAGNHHGSPSPAALAAWAAMAKEAEKQAARVVERSKPAVAHVAGRVLEATGPNGHNGRGRPGSEDQRATSVLELRNALDDAVASGRKVRYDQPLVTRLV